MPRAFQMISGMVVLVHDEGTLVPAVNAPLL